MSTCLLQGVLCGRASEALVLSSACMQIIEQPSTHVNGHGAASNMLPHWALALGGRLRGRVAALLPRGLALDRRPFSSPVQQYTSLKSRRLDFPAGCSSILAS